MKAITPEDLQEWLEEQQNWDHYRHEPPDPSDPFSGPEAEKYFAEQDKQEAAYRKTLNATQMLDYLVFQGVLGDDCPQCHTRYVEVTHFEFPDMVGETYGETWECCGYTWSRNTFCVYDDNGKFVDVR